MRSGFAGDFGGLCLVGLESIARLLGSGATVYFRVCFLGLVAIVARGCSLRYFGLRCWVCLPVLLEGFWGFRLVGHWFLGFG